MHCYFFLLYIIIAAIISITKTGYSNPGDFWVCDGLAVETAGLSAGVAVRVAVVSLTVVVGVDSTSEE
jgi:hypothetical protein